MIVIFSEITLIGVLGHKKISIAEFTTFPEFIRFNCVSIWHLYDTMPLDEKIEFTESLLHQIRPALNGSSTVEFHASISQNDCSAFRNHSDLLLYIRNSLLPNCNPSYGYKFHIYFESNENSTSTVMASLLIMEEIKRCSKVEFLFSTDWGEKKYLPIEEISDWLENSTNGMEKLLKIIFHGVPKFENFQQMISHLETVCF